MASDKIIEERLNEEQNELKRIQDHANELNATKARIRLFGAINKGLYGLNEDDCKEFLDNQAKLAEPIEAVIENSTNEKVFSMPSKKTPDKIQKLIDQNLTMRIFNQSTLLTKIVGKQEEDVTPKSKIMKSNSWANNSPNINNREISRQVSLNPDFKIPKIVTKEKKECNSESFSRLNLADIEPKRVLLDTSEHLDSLSNIQQKLNTDKFQADTSLDKNQAILNCLPMLNTNSEKEKKKISSRKDEFWTGQIITEEGILSAKAVSLYNLDHFYHNKFYFLLNNCFNSSIKSIRSKQVQKCSMFSHLDKLVRTRSHYFSFLKLEPFESTEFKNAIKIMGEEIKTSSSEMYKTFINKLSILNNNESYLEMEIPEPCANLISSLIIFSLKAKNGEKENFFDKIFGLEISRDVDKLMCVIVSKNKETVFNNLNTTQSLSVSTSFEKEKQDDATNNETYVSQEKDKNEQVLNEIREINDFSESLGNKRKNDLVDTCSNDCKKTRLESARSNSSTKDGSNKLSRNSTKISGASTSKKSSRWNDEENNAEKRRKEKNLKITGLYLNADRKKDRSVVEALFKEIGENTNKIQSVRRIMRKNATPIIIVELRDKDDRISVLQNARKLRFSRKFCKVFINRDLTYDEMLIETRDRLNSRNTTDHRKRKWGNY
jgi:hypothetical protein